MNLLTQLTWGFCVALILSACGYDVCVLGAGNCNPSSVQTETKKLLEASLSVTEIHSNFLNGVNFSDLNLTHGVGNFTISIPNTETAVKLTDPQTNTSVFTVTTSSRKIRFTANTGVTTEKDVVITVKDSDSPASTKKIVITIKP